MINGIKFSFYVLYNLSPQHDLLRSSRHIALLGNVFFSTIMLIIFGFKISFKI